MDDWGKPAMSPERCDTHYRRVLRKEGRRDLASG